MTAIAPTSLDRSQAQFLANPRQAAPLVSICGVGPCSSPRLAGAVLLRGVGIFQRKESPMSEGKEMCAFCGDQHWTEARFTAGRLVCSTCWAGRAPAVAMAPSAEGRKQIALWCAPRRTTETQVRT
jgi:hypothetical protein